MTKRSREVDRERILAHRRRANSLEERLPAAEASLHRAAWVGLQDSMPRAALLSIHARVEGTEPDAWEDRVFVQLWGPRYNTYVVAARDLAVFSLARLPDRAAERQFAEGLADELESALEGRRLPYREAARLLGNHARSLAYAGPTGRVLIRWEGARAPTIWTVPRPAMDPRDARIELARRYLHVFGPTAPTSFARWAGIPGRAATAAFQELGGELMPVHTPLGDAWILSADEPSVFADPSPAAPARLLPSGDAYWLLWGADRDLLVPDAAHRAALWTSRVWPGALLVDGEIVGTWRRDQGRVSIEPWRRLSARERENVEAEAQALPLPGVEGRIVVAWGG